MELLYMFSRRLFWRNWQLKLSKLSQHFFFDLVRGLPDSTSYVTLHTTLKSDHDFVSSKHKTCIKLKICTVEIIQASFNHVVA
jgi:hypothetical protein